MAWLSALASLIGILSALVSWLESREKIGGAVAQLTLQHLQAVRDAIADARKIKAEVVERISGPDGKPDPGKLRNDPAGLWRD